LPSGERLEATQLLERVMREATNELIRITLVSKSGQEVSAELAVAPILADRIPRAVQGVCLVETLDAR